jgi:hypothetical protein
LELPKACRAGGVGTAALPGKTVPGTDVADGIGPGAREGGGRKGDGKYYISNNADRYSSKDATDIPKELSHELLIRKVLVKVYHELATTAMELWII